MSQTQDPTNMDRREFVGLTGTAVGAALLPLPTMLMATPSVEPMSQKDLLIDWTIDDMWGVYPRYSEAIGYGQPRALPAQTVAGMDRIFAEYL